MTRAAIRALLRLAPRSLRLRHGREMEALVLDAIDDARPRGRLAVAGVWLRVTIDFLAAHTRTTRRSRSAAAHHPSPERQASMLTSDVRYALRALLRQRGASFLVLAMLSLGIAANIAVFSIVNGLFLKPLPFPEPERLAMINETAPKWNLEYVGVNYPDFALWLRDQRAFEAIAYVDTSSFNLIDGGGAERVAGAMVSANYARVLGLEPLVGRMFTADEDKPGAPPVVVLGERIWRERFNADPHIVGRTLKLHLGVATIVGVMPRATEAADGARLWVSARGNPNQTWQSYGGGAVGRLKAGTTLDAAERDLRRAQQPIWDTRDRERIVTPFVRDMRQEFTRDFSTAALAVSVAVGLLLLVACANVASVMLARALARRREMGIRVAMGAGRLRLVRQLFVENAVLALTGGIVGLLLGRAALALLLRWAPQQAPPWAEFTFDARVAAFTLAASAAATLLFGWAPALQVFRGDVQSAVRDVTRSATTSAGGRRTLQMLVAAECALAAMLLVSGGLLLRAYDRVQHVEPGFRTDHVLTFSMLLPESTYPTDAARLAFWSRLEARLQSSPDVQDAAVISCAPLGCHWGNFYEAEGAPPRAAGEAEPVVLRRYATPNYLATMGVRLVQGRFLNDSDFGPGGARAIVVNETFARTFWPGVANPVGRRVRGRGSKPGDPWHTVVGVTADVRHYGLERPMRPGVYHTLREAAPDAMTIVLRTKTSPETLAPAVRTLVRSLDAELPIFSVRTMEESLRRSTSLRALYSWMLVVFAGLALVLALGGTYGVSAYLVTQRRRELAIRTALGAQAIDVFRSVLTRGLAVAGGGMAIGLAGALVAGRYLGSLLFGVRPYDVTVLATAVSVLLATALIATLWPARRAARLDPVASLRGE